MADEHGPKPSVFPQPPSPVAGDDPLAEMLRTMSADLIVDPAKALSIWSLRHFGYK